MLFPKLRLNRVGGTAFFQGTEATTSPAWSNPASLFHATYHSRGEAGDLALG